MSAGECQPVGRGHALWDIPMRGDLKQVVALTDRGRRYLALRLEIGE
ncbi:MAG: hypothetical protein AB7H96_17980 [Vicinamibacterales bacterium]